VVRPIEKLRNFLISKCALGAGNNFASYRGLAGCVEGHSFDVCRGLFCKIGETQHGVIDAEKSVAAGSELRGKDVRCE
jgi:hypothetical protein